MMIWVVVKIVCVQPSCLGRLPGNPCARNRWFQTNVLSFPAFTAGCKESTDRPYGKGRKKMFSLNAEIGTWIAERDDRRVRTWVKPP
jgi:hypothetical protein